MRNLTFALIWLLATQLQAADANREETPDASGRGPVVSAVEHTPPMPPDLPRASSTPALTGLLESTPVLTEPDRLPEPGEMLSAPVSPTSPTLVEETHDGGASVASACGPSSACASCCRADRCSSHVGFGHPHIPSAFCSRCNMPQHHPYMAVSVYYFFRPYNYFHLEFLREEAVIQGATTANPYDTVVFDNVYAEIDMEAE